MIVGIGHNYQVGKDTAADALCRDLGYRKISFADKLREFMLEVDPMVSSSTARVNVDVGHGRFRWSVIGLGYETAKQTYPEVRRLLQAAGLAARKLFGEDFWVDQAFRGVGMDDRVVFADVRFPNEAQAVLDADGFLLKVVRPGYAGDDHVSEQALAGFDAWDLVITNDGSVTELEQKVVQAVRDEIGRRKLKEVSDADNT